MFFRTSSGHKTALVSAAEALPGRPEPIPTAPTHFLTGAPLTLEPVAGGEVAVFGMGCFWGVERLFWRVPGVRLTMAGYAGGFTPNPTYEEVCSGRTGHAEVVRVLFDSSQVSYDALLQLFWENHDPTQGLRQGNDIGSQYRSLILTFSDAQKDLATRSRASYGQHLRAAGLGAITTEILPAGPFYPAEAYHQQYLAKNPAGYCGLKGTGVPCVPA